MKAVFKPFINSSQASRDFASDKGFATPGALVIEQDAVAGIHAICLTVVHRDPVAIQLGHAIGASRVKRRTLFLGHLLH